MRNFDCTRAALGEHVRDQVADCGDRRAGHDESYALLHSVPRGPERDRRADVDPCARGRCVDLAVQVRRPTRTGRSAGPRPRRLQRGPERVALGRAEAAAAHERHDVCGWLSGSRCHYGRGAEAHGEKHRQERRGVAGGESIDHEAHEVGLARSPPARPSRYSSPSARSEEMSSSSSRQLCGSASSRMTQAWSPSMAHCPAPSTRTALPAGSTRPARAWG